jgi:ABC1 atypical kinase-like domain
MLWVRLQLRSSPPDRIFAFFDQTPLASASIGQVHVAQLFDGREVVVKVRKPGVDELVQRRSTRSGDFIKDCVEQTRVIEIGTLASEAP